jgi:hypothetical protein
MPDANIKQVKISRQNLQSTSVQGKYKIRYRVLSSNKSPLTNWSDYVELVPSKTIIGTTGTVTPQYSYTSPNVTISWTISTPTYVKYYDVYIQWYTTSAQDWVYYATVTSTDNTNYSYTAPKISGATKVRAAVFSATYPKLTNSEINAAGTSGNNGYMNLVFNNTAYTNTP